MAVPVVGIPQYTHGVTHNPPFRADIVGSFLRPEVLHEARTAHAEGRLDDGSLAEIEDQAIGELLIKEADAGLQLATDGEFRRSWWHFDFFGGLGGVEIVELDHGI